MWMKTLRNIIPNVPELSTKLIQAIQNYYSDNPLSSIAWTSGAEKVVTTNEWEWKMKGAGCSDEVEETEIKLFKMHDVNDGEELNYCISCIEIYKNENL